MPKTMDRIADILYKVEDNIDALRAYEKKNRSNVRTEVSTNRGSSVLVLGDLLVNLAATPEIPAARSRAGLHSKQVRGPPGPRF